MSPILTPQRLQALDELSRKVTERNIPGFVYGISSQEGEIYFTSGGHKVIHDPLSGAVDPDTVLWICSMTKLIAHLAALQLVERGLLSVDTPVSEYFPVFKEAIILDDFASKTSTFTSAKGQIRIRHLLNHTSGLKYAERPPGVVKLGEAYTHSYHEDEDPVDTFFKLVKGPYPLLPLKFEPGTDFAYGWNSDVLGFIVEKVTGKTLEQFCQENIFQPLDMKTSFYLTPELQKNFMWLSHRKDDGQIEPWTGELLVNERDPKKAAKAHLGGVGMYSSLRDYLKLLRHTLQIHNGNATNPILKSETVKTLFEPTLNDKGVSSLSSLVLFTDHRPNCQWSNSLALCTADWPGGRKKGSAFWSGWAGTYFHIDPQTSIAAVFGTQIYPSRDAEVLQTFAQFERTLYDGLQQ
ncbi:beta-lactamase/transpeptidase-like protein [Panaeolus papilionaceus]|nr:beta-lactamase/transpeptidase-like protein [Panaeolus papilionaceus]